VCGVAWLVLQILQQIVVAIIRRIAPIFRRRLRKRSGRERDTSVEAFRLIPVPLRTWSGAAALVRFALGSTRPSEPSALRLRADMTGSVVPSVVFFPDAFFFFPFPLHPFSPFVFSSAPLGLWACHRPGLGLRARRHLWPRLLPWFVLFSP
jgi:hypothetical protein